MTGDVMVHETLPADARSVREARAVVRTVLAEAALSEDWAERAMLAVSELVTNAVVHAGTDVQLRIHLRGEALRVEIEDNSPTVPSARSHALTAVTGRGLFLVESNVDRWDVETRPDGKTVWFEIGDPLRLAGQAPPDPSRAVAAVPTDVEVVLEQMPLLLHAAWQEQITAILREFLLARLESDPGVLESHAQASDALALLFEQVPTPDVDDDPDVIMVGAVEPLVTAPRVVLRVPRTSVPHFETLETIIVEALAMAREGELLANPTQPEIAAMRAWLCRQVREQAAGTAAPEPFDLRADIAPVPHEGAVPPVLRALAASDEAVLVTDVENRIVAVTRPVLDALGYAEESDLLGRRVVAVIPARFHQAHVAGVALHQTNGRDVLLGTHLTVPVLRADGTEVALPVTVTPEVLDGDVLAYVARFG
ncbi:hypothetical protein GCM10023340_42090 [Nocardioides marinquilinus]|uniref:Histidine kinase/HSP90-like ATPase domain-containing protein n=1 Tax=Nocardioides marinquilinus TaxID=1210400 RepID=A0ABP9Q7D6_9ACTN